VKAACRPPRFPINPLECEPLAQLGRKLPGRPAYTTLMDWCKRGRVNWNTRKRVKMEFLALPSGFASSLEAYLRFVDRLNEGR
jgi:hypothetical protein